MNIEHGNDTSGLATAKGNHGEMNVGCALLPSVLYRNILHESGPPSSSKPRWAIMADDRLRGLY